MTLKWQALPVCLSMLALPPAAYCQVMVNKYSLFQQLTTKCKLLTDGSCHGFCVILCLNQLIVQVPD